MPIIRVALILLAVAILPARSTAFDLPRGPTPDWVDVAAIGAFDSGLYRYIVDGKAYRLVDRQVRWADGRKDTYLRIAIEAANRAALESVATVTRDFDPASETLTMTRLDLIRGDRRTDMRDSATADIFRRETGLEEGIIDGTLTALVQIPDVRVGDIVDVAFIWSSTAYFDGADKADLIDLEYAVPVGLSRVVLNWPTTAPLILAPDQPGVARSETQTDETRRIEWRLPGRAPRQFDDDMPPEYDPYATVAYSGLSGWGDLVAALGPYYRQEYPLPVEWAEKLSAIKAAHDDDADRAFAALRLVQDEVRYVGLEVGAGGYFARSPETVVANGFGDCKDKALLLATMLRDLGLRSTVALANLDAGYGLADSLPSALAFDHMIAGVWLNGGWVWMDPTASYEGGAAGTALQPDYGYVLPLAEGTSDLQMIDQARRQRYSKVTTETHDFNFFGMLLAVETVKSGDAANSERAYWASTPIGEIARNYLTYYASSYPGIQSLQEPEMIDDRAANEVRIREYYLLPRDDLAAGDLTADFPFYAPQPFSIFPDAQIGERQAPLYVPHGLAIEHHIRVRGAPIEFVAPDPVEIENPAFAFRFSSDQWDGGNLDLNWSFASKSRTVPPAEVKGVIHDANAASAWRTFYWNLDPEDADNR